MVFRLVSLSKIKSNQFGVSSRLSITSFHFSGVPTGATGGPTTRGFCRTAPRDGSTTVCALMKRGPNLRWERLQLSGDMGFSGNPQIVGLLY